MTQQIRRAVFKLGSEVVTNNQGVDVERIISHAGRIITFCDAENLAELIVSSGSVRAGRAEAPHIKDDQVLAGLGSAGVVMAWKSAAALFDRLASQATATDYEMMDTEERGTFRTALIKDLDLGIIPIFNTNDKMNDEELPKRPWGGENDGPAAHIAILIEADLLFLLTTGDGLFDDGGNTIREVPYDPEIRQRTLSMLETRGKKTQGIYRKAEAGFEATDAGVHVYIADADDDLHQIIAGNRGTYLAPKPQDM